MVKSKRCLDVGDLPVVVKASFPLWCKESVVWNWFALRAVGLPVGLKSLQAA